MKLLRETIRKILIEEIESTNEEDDMIKQLAFSISPPPTQQQRIEELMTIQYQIDFPFNPPELHDTLDDNFYQLFVDLLRDNGIQESSANLKAIAKNLVPTIKSLKNQFDLERPQMLANSIGMQLNSKQDTMKSAQTTSYPSGHTIQAYAIANTLINKYPFLHSKLIAIANQIAQSRIDAGVHFPSDIASGIVIANQLVETDIG